MKKFYSILLALLAIVGVANAAENGGTVKAGEVYPVTKVGKGVDIEFTTEESVPSGKRVVVFYNVNAPTSVGVEYFYFGSGGSTSAQSKVAETDSKGNKVIRNIAPAKMSTGNPVVIDMYEPDGEANVSTWCYVICDESEVTTVANPAAASTGGGAGSSMEKGEYAGGAGTKSNPYVVTKDKYYEIIGDGQAGYVDEQYFKHESSTTSQYIVVFYIDPEGGKIYNPFLNQNDKSYLKYSGEGTLGTVKESDGSTWSRFYRQSTGDADLIQIFEPSTPKGIWCYAIVDSESEAQTVENPYFAGSAGPVADLDGQTEEKAFTLTQLAKTLTAPKSKTSNTEYVIYAKFEASADGTATVTMPEGETNGKYLKKPGDTTYKTFNFDNSFEVVQGETYYIWYRYKSEVTGEAKYSLREAGAGESRGAAILIEADGTQTLLGVPSVEVEGGKDYTNTTTWFKLEKEGALDGMTLMTVKIGGNNTTEVALYQNDETSPIKTYAMGDGSGMLAKNSTVKFDINLAENDYYIAITQDDVNGTANFTFSVAQPGETIATAKTATVGSNTVSGTAWYKYTHSGDRKVIKVTGISKIVNEEGGLVAEGDDVKVGFVITEGTSIYFEAAANFTITLSDVEKGMTADDPIIIDNENGATFNLSGAATDTQRFMQYAATEDGTFTYGTDNANVIEWKPGATVRDVTNAESPKIVTIVQEENAEYGMFIYQWPVVAGHTYSIEQGLGNNFGKVEFYTMFNAAEAGETIGKAFPIDLYEAVDLGRAVATPKYYKFTAAEAGDYTVSVQLTGYVKSYDADGNGTSIQKSYSDGLVYHNGTFTLAAGESLVFSCEPSETIEHVAGGVNDAFIPNYYATVTKADETGGLDYTQPMEITENDEMSLDAANVWYGPITVPAGSPLYVKATLNDETETSAVYFAVETATSGLQWINKDAELSAEIEGKTQIFTLASSTEERQIHLLGYGLLAAGTFHYSFTEPQVGPAAENLTIIPTVVFDADDNTLTIKATLPETFDESETAVENLNMWAYSITNTTTSETIELTNGGDGTYNAGEKLTAINKVDNASFFNAEDTYLVTFGCPTTSNVVISALPVSLSAPSTEISELVEDVTILNLKAGKAYTLNANAVLATDVVKINGNGATITVGEAGKFSVQKGIVLDNVVLDGTATANAIVELSSAPDASLATYTMEGETATYKYEGANQKVYEAQEITIKNSTVITNNSVIRGGAAWALRNLSIDNSIIEVKYKSGKAIINMEENDANSVQNISIKNSTIYADDAATDMRFIRYTNASNAQSQKVWGTADNNASLTLTNNTFVGVCGNKEFANNYVNNKLYQFTFKNNAFINTWRINKLGTNNTRNFEQADNVISGGTNAVDGTDANWFTAVDDLGAVWNFGEGEGQTAVPVATDVEALGAAFGLYDDYKTFGDPRWADYSKGEAPTGITNVASQSAKNGAIYNLAGQRVDANAKGILIINGKKVLKK